MSRETLSSVLRPTRAFLARHRIELAVALAAAVVGALTWSLSEAVGLAAVAAALAGAAVSIAYTETAYRRAADLRRAALREVRGALHILVEKPLFSGNSDSLRIGRAWAIRQFADAAARGELERQFPLSRDGESVLAALEEARVDFRAAVATSMTDLPEEVRRQVYEAQDALLHSSDAVLALLQLQFGTKG